MLGALAFQQAALEYSSYLQQLEADQKGSFGLQGYSSRLHHALNHVCRNLQCKAQPWCHLHC